MELAWSGSDMFSSACKDAFQQRTNDTQQRARLCAPYLSRRLDGICGPADDTFLRLVAPLGVSPLFRYYGNELEVGHDAVNRTEVWLAEVIISGQLQHRSVALKLYDERLLEDSITVDELLEAGTPCRRGTENAYTMAWNEAVAYQKAERFQGSYLPYSYGHYQVCLPSRRCTLV